MMIRVPPLPRAYQLDCRLTRPVAARFSHLALFRSKYVFGPSSACPEDIACVEDIAGVEDTPLVGPPAARAMISSHTVLVPVAFDDPGPSVEALFRDKGKPTWLDYFEVVKLGFQSTPAKRRYSGDVDDDGIEESWERDSYFLAQAIEATGFEVPTFGRKLLIIDFEPTDSDRELERLDRKVRKLLGGGVRGVWRGPSFRAYCFKWSGRCADAMLRIEPVVNVREVNDYLLVEPIAVPIPQECGLSPLADWVETGFTTAQQAFLGNQVARRKSFGWR